MSNDELVNENERLNNEILKLRRLIKHLYASTQGKSKVHLYPLNISAFLALP